VPGDKSISHRAMIFGLLAIGETKVSGLLEGEDVMRTAAAARALGAIVHHDGPGSLARARRRHRRAARTRRNVLDFGNAGTGSRLMMGVCGAIRSPRPSMATPRCASGRCGASSIRSN
jgi:3-phosphoshikimate 1-carboxyvinyltransferase